MTTTPERIAELEERERETWRLYSAVTELARRLCAEHDEAEILLAEARGDMDRARWLRLNARRYAALFSAGSAPGVAPPPPGPRSDPARRAPPGSRRGSTRRARTSPAQRLRAAGGAGEVRS